MKYSLISATSIVALLAAGIGSAQAGPRTTAQDMPNLYDFVHDGMTSADGGDRTVTRQDPTVSAVMALHAATGGLWSVTLTGASDAAIGAETSVPSVPLGAAAGAKPAEDLATVIIDTGNPQWDAMLKARAIGQERIASLIGSIGASPADNPKQSRTVFQAVANTASFDDGPDAGRSSRPGSAYVYLPSSTNTATITVAGIGGTTRPDQENGLSITAANNPPPASPAAGAPDTADATRTVAMSDTTRQTLGYTYAPVVDPAAKTTAVAAAFSDAPTAKGVRVADWKAPADAPVAQAPTAGGRVLASQSPAPGQAAPARVETSEIATTDPSRVLDLSRSASRGTNVDGTRRFMSASVSVNPATSTTLYMASVAAATPTSPVNTGQSMEAFVVGPRPGSSPGTRTASATTVSEPLRGKILASAGPLNSNLALP